MTPCCACWGLIQVTFRMKWYETIDPSSPIPCIYLWLCYTFMLSPSPPVQVWFLCFNCPDARNDHSISQLHLTGIRTIFVIFRWFFLVLSKMGPGSKDTQQLDSLDGVVFGCFFQQTFFQNHHGFGWVYNVAHVIEMEIRVQCAVIIMYHHNDISIYPITSNPNKKHTDVSRQCNTAFLSPSQGRGFCCWKRMRWVWMSSFSKGGRCSMALGAGESCIKGRFQNSRARRDLKLFQQLLF